MKAYFEKTLQSNALELEEAQQALKKELEAKDKELEGYRDALAAKEEELKEDQSEPEEQDKKEAKDKTHSAEAQLANTAQTGLSLDADGDASPGVRRHQQQHSLTPSAPSAAQTQQVAERRGGEAASADW